MKAKDDDDFFVIAKDPSEIKRSLLESLKDIVESLQRFEKFKSVREEKLENVDKLRADIKELIKLNSSLKAAMPETKLRISLDKKKSKAKKKIVRVEEKHEEIETEVSKPMTELEKLQSELSVIESRLGSLK